ncbi:molybdenum cofactor biosynthesis protein B [Microbacterium sp. CIAB417]|uniref:MogA/MoaB family molybdenum cofactor biosynthesis protein n=1 Tax=Microbacterium sp. CIAB417 TaxID=2860287 RepID=UPI001FAD3466|nr:MogA/MoaB family molybdenum cofactor biosynthesis protein [Microbacterium sp. CIAB417]
MSRTARVITVSDRAAEGLREDLSGPAAVELLHASGWAAHVTIVPDETARIAAAIRMAAADGARLIITTGGTGISPRDVTPEATLPLLDPVIPGIAEEVRRIGAAKLPTALLSRGVAGIHEAALVVNLAGSPGAVRDGVPLILGLVDHVLSQRAGGDHA